MENWKTGLNWLSARYTDDELGALLGVSGRSVVNYRDGNTPHKKTQRKIFETYVKQSAPNSAIDKKSIEATLLNLSEDKIRSTAMMEKLVALLEKQGGEIKVGDTGDGGTEAYKKEKSA